MINNDKLIEKLRDYEQEHSDLDQILIQLQEKHTVNFLQIQRLKKRKLILKDRIMSIKSELEPVKSDHYENFSSDEDIENIS